MIQVDQRSTVHRSRMARLGVWLSVVFGFVALIAGSATEGPTVAQIGQTLGCDGNNPHFAVALIQRSRDSVEPAVIGLNDTQQNKLENRTTIANAMQVGVVNGLAYDPQESQIYAAAFVHLTAEFGPGGPGAVYQIDLNSGMVINWFTLQSTPQDLDPHNLVTILPRIGQVGIGDIDLDPHNDLLFISDLTEQRIRVVSTLSRKELVSFAHGATDEPWAANARLYGLAIHDGYVYHGLVDSRLDLGLVGEARAIVYQSRYDGSEMRRVATIPLDYRAEPAWQPWKENTRYINRLDLEPQALVGDIGFTAAGDMLVALRDRGVDLSWGGSGEGDLLYLRGTEDGQWKLGDPEHFADDTSRYSEPLYGTLAMNRGRLSVIATSASPFDRLDGSYLNSGLRWFFTRNGKQQGVMDAREPARSDEDLVLGDVELLCDSGDLTPVASFTPPTTPSATGRPPTDTSTPTTATPTATLTPSLSPPVPTSTRSVTHPTPTSIPLRPSETPLFVYLPVLDNASCTMNPLAVVLIIDVSTSMDSYLPSGERRLDVALYAAQLLATTLEARGERIAVVAFNNSAWVEQSLTAAPGDATAALKRLRGKLEEGTRIDLALIRAREQVAARDPQDSVIAATILLTDGQPNRVPPAADGRPETTILEAARDLRAAGSVIYSVGFGPRIEINQSLLCMIGDQCYAEHDGPGLARLYELLPNRIRCDYTQRN